MNGSGKTNNMMTLTTGTPWHCTSKFPFRASDCCGRGPGSSNWLGRLFFFIVAPLESKPVAYANHSTFHHYYDQGRNKDGRSINPPVLWEPSVAGSCQQGDEAKSGSECGPDLRHRQLISGLVEENDSVCPRHEAAPTPAVELTQVRNEVSARQPYGSITLPLSARTSTTVCLRY